ncbi:nucleotide exchange factor GrpE [Patescibacteria group bacterium]|nr:nucleotide exchange factor GrpE [Patescibacteria group bacterium]
MTEEKNTNNNGNDNENLEDIVVEEEGIPADLQLKKLREKLKKCMAEKEEYLAGWQRAKADFINARNEEKENRTELLKFANEEIIEDILPVLDSFDLAFNNENWQKLDKIWQEGIKLIYNKFIDTLKKHGIEKIETINKKFNPEEHESLGEIEIEDSPRGEAGKNKEGVVLEEIRKGYKIHNKLLRPAQVRVGKTK